MATTTQQTSTWNLDPAHSLIEVSAKHMMITTVRGRFTDVKGTITVDEQHPDRSRVEVEIPAASIDTHVDQRDQHLRSADFLDVARYPTITFRSTRIQGAWNREGDRFTVTGDLTVHGVTKPVTLAATYEGGATDPRGGRRVGFSADTEIDRRQFGLTWNQALEAGGILVGNDLRIHLEVQAVKAA
ncbi:MAG TPA: YceI family protein [Gemmatimonadales bacterium]|nr:YceI family protein [Gemmatimonadales bacterium]